MKDSVGIQDPNWWRILDWMAENIPTAVIEQSQKATLIPSVDQQLQDLLKHAETLEKSAGTFSMALLEVMAERYPNGEEEEMTDQEADELADNQHKAKLIVKGLLEIQDGFR